MNQIIIGNTTVNKNKLECQYLVDGEWGKYFKCNESFFVEYSKNIDSVPKSVAIIPFLCNILPMIWLFDAEMILDEIDQDFYESIDRFKQGYIDMYPQLNFLGKIKVNNVVKNQQNQGNKSAAFFSGGVDAYETLLSHIDETPTLVTLWGADIKLTNTAGWERVENHIKQAAKENGLEYVIIKSSFREFINEDALSNYVSQFVDEGWWHGFQHGIGLLGHFAPYAYQYQIKMVYIASSFTIADKDKITCASDPTIDNYVKFSGCQVFHDGYEYNRQDKIRRICEYVKKTGQKIQLRVCWESSGGSNCCHCEKCYRTLLGIIAENENPREYGFNYSDEQFIIMMKDMKNRIVVRNNFRYSYIQNAFRKNYSRNNIDKNLRWFYVLDINSERPSLSELFFRGKRKLKRILF